MFSTYRQNYRICFVLIISLTVRNETRMRIFIKTILIKLIACTQRNNFSITTSLIVCVPLQKTIISPNNTTQTYVT